MSYPTPAAPRIPYDADGTRVLVTRGLADVSAPVEIPHRSISALNADIGEGLLLDGDEDWTFGTHRLDYFRRPWIALVFPRPMTLKGWALSALSSWGLPSALGAPQEGKFANLTVRLQVSSNTTNGVDGTWTTVGVKDENDQHLPVNLAAVLTSAANNDV